MPESSNTARRGAIAGILAAAALILFFFVVDALEGEPLRTPSFLASVLFGESDLRAGAGFIAIYTLLHFLVFAVIGVVVSLLLEKAKTPPMFLLGVVLGFLLFDIVFYASIWLTGVDVVHALGWPEFLMGNFIAGVVLMAYLHFAGPGRTVAWTEMLREHRVLREGLIAGLIGAVAVALWFLVVDAVIGRLFFTPGALGSVIFAGASSLAEVQVNAGTVGGYTLVHVAAFLGTGMFVSFLACQAEDHPPLILAAGLLFVTFETLFIGLLAIMASWLLDTLQWWTIAAGNLVAALAMGWYMWKVHPKLQQVLRNSREVENVDAFYGLRDTETPVAAEPRGPTR